MRKIFWKRSFLSPVYHFFKEKTEIGTLENSFWFSESKGVLNKQVYRFRRSSLWNRNIEVYNLRNKVMAEITFTPLFPKAIVKVRQQSPWVYSCKDILLNQWQLTDKKGKKISCKSDNFKQKGYIIDEIRLSLLVLISLYVHYKYIKDYIKLGLFIYFCWLLSLR